MSLPLLNNPEYQIPNTRTREDDEIEDYNVRSMFQKRTACSQDRFDKIYYSVLRHFTQTERPDFIEYQKGNLSVDNFQKIAVNYLREKFPIEMSNSNDLMLMMERLNYAMFEFDFITPLIRDNKITDIKICSKNDIRVRVDGKAKRSNVMFLDDKDVYRFIEGLAIRNNVDLKTPGILHFTDKSADDYLLRFEITPPSITMDGIPAIHIRKVSRIKKTFEDLEYEGMTTLRLVPYFKEITKHSKFIIVAGPPGSGKSTFLNTLIEQIPICRESLIIQDSEELYTEQSGFIIEHVEVGFGGRPTVSQEELCYHALVQGCNEVIVGEVKKAIEMQHIATLSNTGVYVMLTLHTLSAKETLYRAGDLVKEGTNLTVDEARNRLKECTVIYLEGYKIQEIVESTGYNMDTHEYEYREIYKRSLDQEALELDKQVLLRKKREEGYLV